MAASPHLGGGSLQELLGGLQQLLALAGPLLLQARVEAHQQALVEELRAADLGHLIRHQFTRLQGALT